MLILYVLLTAKVHYCAYVLKIMYQERNLTERHNFEFHNQY